MTRCAGKTNDHGGTGLGLFISKALMTAHKAEIYSHNNTTDWATLTRVLSVDQSIIIYE